ncbi:CbtA family protein [Litoreibacter roseus]|uniref:Membrane protein n=1 Tax=Litoreibacter roseus TaxID=2601869 RepID=A0A6N6JFU1_9RHOB|nr:CbtA family protein [Litoreibacter roseus]GFE65004.1 membrane protein [Litoreibacter roseus]
MLKHILTSAVFAGVAVGVLAAAVQLWLMTPLLLEGELFETGARVHFAADGSPQSEAGPPSLMDEPVRHLTTAGFGIVTFTAFGFLMAAGFALATRAGHVVTPRAGLIWGLCGFIAVQLAPAVGLSPELPGTVAPEVEMRQAWWLGTVIATTVALALIAFGRGTLSWIIATALILAPHIVGAPHLDTYYGVAPPELSAHFAARSLGTSALSWCLLGLIAATVWSHQEEAS